MVLYVNGERYKGGEYQGQRTVVDLIQFLESAEAISELQESDKIKNHTEMALAKHLNMTKAHADWLDAMNRVRHHVDRMWDVQEHPGCHLVGRLEMNRAPGHFFIQAKSESHSIDPRNANLSHAIHHLAFQPILDWRQYAKNPDMNVVFPDHFDQSKATSPLDGLVFALEQQHTSWHHYLKLISTNTHHFQVLKSSQLSLYREDHVPEAKFVMDVSPIAISYSKRKRRWYDYITSIMAILGGTFTVVGLIESMVETTAKKITQQRGRKQPLRRPPPLPTPPPPLPPPPRMGAVGADGTPVSTMRRVHPHPPPVAAP
jgi:Endoplasmic reticulum vesicle transporter